MWLLLQHGVDSRFLGKHDLIIRILRGARRLNPWCYEQFFVCYRGKQKGKAVSKQRLAHCIMDAIALAYQSQGETCPLGVRAHSTWSVASFYALAHSASLADICRAAGWVTPNTFTRFYNLRVEPVSSCVLGNR